MYKNWIITFIFVKINEYIFFRTGLVNKKIVDLIREKEKQKNLQNSWNDELFAWLQCVLLEWMCVFVVVD